ncbi:MAG TPA: YceI family protein [Geobacteraceae bacterium]
MAEWIIDPDHSVAAFSVRHMMIAHVHGQFNGVRGVIRFDPAGPAGLSVEAEIDAAGIYTGIGKRDEHLRSPDFFDAAHYPTITFTGKTAEAGAGGLCRVTGDLTIRGITRTVTIEGTYCGPVDDPFEEGARSIGFTGSTVVDREDYGMTWNVPMGGGFMVGREVRITLNVEADLAGG